MSRTAELLDYIKKKNVTSKEIIEDEEMLLEIVNLLQTRLESSLEKLLSF